MLRGLMFAPTIIESRGLHCILILSGPCHDATALVVAQGHVQAILMRNFLQSVCETSYALGAEVFAVRDGKELPVNSQQINAESRR